MHLAKAVIIDFNGKSIFIRQLHFMQFTFGKRKFSSWCGKRNWSEEIRNRIKCVEWLFPNYENCGRNAWFRRSQAAVLVHMLHPAKSSWAKKCTEGTLNPNFRLNWSEQIPNIQGRKLSLASLMPCPVTVRIFKIGNGILNSNGNFDAELNYWFQAWSGTKTEIAHGISGFDWKQ